MDIYQRESVNVAVESLCYDCDDVTSDLPLEVLQAAHHGDVDKIQDYLDKGHDVNALYEGESLLSRACAEGHIEILKVLLQSSKIHLNGKFEEKTPLVRAAQNGHVECARLLLNSSVTCAIVIDKCWKTVLKVLKMQPELTNRSLLHILKYACHKGHWDVIQIILQTSQYFSKEDLYPVVMTAVDKNHWDIICDVFKRDFNDKNELINEVLVIAVHLRWWRKSQELLHMMNEDLKLEVPFVEAALGGRINEVNRLLAEKQYNSQILNGNLLVVAAGGTSDLVAELLMTIKNTYTKRTFSDALFLAALRHCAEMFICLLSNAEAQYSIKDFDKANTILKFQTRYERYRPKEYLSTFLNNYLKMFQEAKLESLIP